MLIVLVILIVLFLIYNVIPTFYYKLKMSNRKKQGKVIYLTFDDGPSEYTTKLLDLLKRYDVRASFFCVASFCDKHKDVIKRMINEGHLVGMHSFSHKSAYLMGLFGIKNDFKNSLNLMSSFCDIKYYRPPWGHINLFTLYYVKKYNLKLILWNVMAEDWKGDTTSKEIEEKLLNRIAGNDIICLHDGRGKNSAPLKTIDALEVVIPRLLKDGYRFEMIDRYEK